MRGNRFGGHNKTGEERGRGERCWGREGGLCYLRQVSGRMKTREATPTCHAEDRGTRILVLQPSGADHRRVAIDSNHWGR